MLRGCTAALPQKSQTSATEELQPRGSGNNASCGNQAAEGFTTSKMQGTCCTAPLLHTCWPQASPHEKLSCPPRCPALLGRTSILQSHHVSSSALPHLHTPLQPLAAPKSDTEPGSPDTGNSGCQDLQQGGHRTWGKPQL